MQERKVYGGDQIRVIEFLHLLVNEYHMSREGGGDKVANNVHLLNTSSLVTAQTEEEIYKSNIKASESTADTGSGLEAINVEESESAMNRVTSKEETDIESQAKDGILSFLGECLRLSVNNTVSEMLESVEDYAVRRLICLSSSNALTLLLSNITT